MFGSGYEAIDAWRVPAQPLIERTRTPRWRTTSPTRAEASSARQSYDTGMRASDYAERYAPVAPNPRPGPDDTRRLLTGADGVQTMPGCVAGMPVPHRVGDAEARHLWVILPADVPVILESAPDVRPPPLALGVAKHTNLTGGGPACCGGELWRDPTDAKRLHLTGASGRYPARSAEQLEDAVLLMATFGFAVRSAGWSEENDCPERVFRD